MCVYGINVGAGSTNPQLGCKNVTVLAGNPFGDLNTYVGLPDSKLRVTGWAIDPDTTTAIETHLYVDGTYNSAMTAAT